MNSQPDDSDYRSSHEIFSQDHNAQREQIMQRIASLPEPVRSEQRHNRRFLHRSLVALAVVILLAIGAPFLWDGQQEAYGMEGYLDRLLAIRSAEIRGFLRQEIVEQDGKKTRKKFPVRYFFERPGKLSMEHYGFSSPSNDEPTLIRHMIKSLDHDVLEIQLPNQKKIATRIDPRLTELRIEQMIQSLLPELLLTSPPESFEKLRSEELEGVNCDVYSVTTGEGAIRSTQRIWLNPRTGLPEQIAVFDVDESGEEQLTMMLGTIDVDVTAPQDLFPLQQVERNNDDRPAERTNIEAIGSATAGPVGIAKWYSLQLDETTVLCCWSQRETIDGETLWFNQQPAFKLNSADEVRNLESQPIRDFESNGVRWRWSVVRSDKPCAWRTLHVSATHGRNTASASLLPLRFPKSRLNEIFDLLQSLTGSEEEASATTLDSLISSPD
ncbi:MAG: hypothetical protein K0U86_19235 [Planctomycetes bacterium]|nr:hypothetical protein [Planctomycetota bacterium]MCH9727041.1 hypothetical protein [Planctomycetota bacterium]MCH9774984.1 hypothetical protein [Planctomycetota bacterium]